MTPGEASVCTGRTETQAAEIPAPRESLPDAVDALCTRASMDYGAPVGREVQLPSAVASCLEVFAKLVGKAVARGDFERARELIDEARAHIVETVRLLIPWP